MRTVLFPLFAARHHKSHARAAAFNLSAPSATSDFSMSEKLIDADVRTLKIARKVF